MNIFIFTLGTRGDVQPYVALGRGLKSAGHRVTLCTSARFASFVRDHGLEASEFNDDFMQLVDSEAGRAAMEGGNLWQRFHAIRRLLRQAGRVQRLMIDDGWRAAQAAAPEVIVFHPKAYGAVHFAEKLGVPAVLAMAMPVMVPTRDFPAMGLPSLPLGGGYNRATHRLMLKVMQRGFDRFVRPWRAAHGLPPEARGRNILHTQRGEPIRVLHGYSRHVGPVPADWPSSTSVTGYWFLDAPMWEPPLALRNFLSSGSPPVFVGFGSMSGTEAGRRTQVVLAALARTGRRAIISAGWGGLEPGSLPPTILPVADVPHDWLFPRVAAVVHHGGAGTTAAGLRAGRPTVICPFVADQPFWGRCVHDRGAGPKPIPQRKLTAENLADAIQQAVTSPAIHESARSLGEKIRAEDGLAAATAAIEEVAR